ncbi:isopeptide-forming domain-containing fimbrial protein [Butyrivibrio sp. AC2005]|uniref:isopeptide-forming domain-containing fimbrial protein n=1 Tax=Butyrivibrio sp. AC2005 TaxID=1280672 RepID=UPI0003FA699E|nr:isopeptide-forming domain-containing fimbrial protein [Butyrivibrio sp. AC2005]
MKGLKKILTGILAGAMALTITLSAGTAMDAKAETGNITITPAEGVTADETNTYKIYKVFDAVADGDKVSYKLVSGKTTAPAGFTVDAQGNVSYTGEGENGQLTEADITAIAAYVTEADLVDTATSTGQNVATSKTLPNGYYYITTGLGTAVSIDTAHPNAAVQDKNSTHTVDKTITGASEISPDGKKALEQIGQSVTYTATVNVGNGAKNLKFHDTMSVGLTYNNDAAVTGTTKAGAAVTGTDWYNVEETPAQGDTLTITFNDDIPEGTYTVTYSATVNASAATATGLPNDAYLTYGDNYHTEHSVATVYNATIKVLKKDGSGNPLAGAGFKLMNSEGKYFKLVNGNVTWVDEATDADEHMSIADGTVPAFEGLKNGEYTLTESTVPAGYNKAADEKVTISGGNFSENELTKLVQEVPVINNAGAMLPSTGGIGTTIFYIIGGLLIVAAVVFFVVRRKSDAE